MPLTPEQKLTLRTALQADTTVLAFSGGNQQINTVFGQANLGAGDAAVIAEYYNQPTSPAFWGYPSNVSVAAVVDAIDGGEYLVLGANAAASNLHHNLLDLVLRNGVIHPGSVAVRNQLLDIFPAGTAPLTRAAILSACTRVMNNVEKVFKTTATGPAGGDGSAQNSAANLPFEGTVSGNDISDIHGLPA